jgi:hypothetical protein
MKSKDNPRASSMLKKDDLIVIGGAGGFIAGALTRYFHDQGFTRIRAIDKSMIRASRVFVLSIRNPFLNGIRLLRGSNLFAWT